MKFRMLACVVAACCLLAGCESKDSNSISDSLSAQTESTSQSVDDETTVIPDDVSKKLSAVLEYEPVPVPESGWTDEGILNVTYVNGEKLTMPFALNDLGNGFGFLTDEDNFLVKDSGVATTLTFYGRKCGLCSTVVDATPDNFAEQALNMLTFNNMFKEEYPEIFPISINGVTIGTSYDDMVSRLGFAVEEDHDDPNDGAAFTITAYTESYYIRISGINAIINSMTIGERQE